MKKLIVENESDDVSLKDELNETIELLENDTRTFEDLEFQYLEEETEWLAYREELHNEQKILSRRINEKRKHIQSLETQGIDNQNAACADTKSIEKDLWSILKELEKYREELKTIDILLYELSGEKNAQSESDEDVSVGISTVKRPHNDIMSQSLFGSQEILATKKTSANDLMSKSVNENLFSNKIETLSFGESPTIAAEKESDVHYATIEEVNAEKRNSIVSLGKTHRQNGDSANERTRTPPSGEQPNTSVNTTADDSKADDENADPLQKLKYNLSPPFDHKTTHMASSANESANKAANLNLSIESDDFEVNPLERRVPSQDDIDRICKVQTEAPISTQGYNNKVIESIKEIERNRQLLLTQQGEF